MFFIVRIIRKRIGPQNAAQKKTKTPLTNKAESAALRPSNNSSVALVIRERIACETVENAKRLGRK